MFHQPQGMAAIMPQMPYGYPVPFPTPTGASIMGAPGPTFQPPFVVNATDGTSAAVSAMAPLTTAVSSITGANVAMRRKVKKRKANVGRKRTASTVASQEAEADGHSANPPPGKRRGRKKTASSSNRGGKTRPSLAGRTRKRQRRGRTTPAEKAILDNFFNEQRWPDKEERVALAEQLGWTAESVRIWFQNERRVSKKRWQDEHPGEPLPTRFVNPKEPNSQYAIANAAEAAAHAAAIRALHAAAAAARRARS